jgi:hypothetical protein
VQHLRARHGERALRHARHAGTSCRDERLRLVRQRSLALLLLVALLKVLLREINGLRECCEVAGVL